jgi:hypothetical protein
VTWWRKGTAVGGPGHGGGQPGTGRRPGRAARPDPFAALSLAASPGLTDDDVRAAWRRVAAATHPDRADGGDPARFAEAAAAYTALRTRSGRGEAMADAATGRARREGPARARATTGPASWMGLDGAFPVKKTSRLGPGALMLLGARVRRGRPARLALRVLAAAAASAAAIAVAGARPAGPALVTGAVTWLLLTARRDLAPPR